MTTYHDVVIVGTGHAGAQLAIALRSRKLTGSIAMIGEESDFPYERPPLSKDYLTGAKTFERLLIRPPSFWEDRGINVHPNCRIVSVDSERHLIAAADGREFNYGTLVWAAGGHARNLTCAGHDQRGVHSVRTRHDVDLLISELPDTSRVCVIGGGYIGLEAASALSKLGIAVTIVEAQDRVLARVAGPALSRFFENEHRAHGVEVRLGAVVECILERNGRACGVRLADGTEVPCDMVIVGVGIVPAVRPLLAAGAACSNGVAVDELCRTSLPEIYAIGDCALHANTFADGASIRLESVQNANDMAATVARAITGDAAPYKAVPWFWSQQFDLKLQTVGLSQGHDEEVVRGTVEERSFSVLYLRSGRLIALDCVNQVPDYVQGKALVEQRAVLPVARLADAHTPLKSLATGHVAD